MKMTEKTMMFAGVACLTTILAVPLAVAQDAAPAAAPAPAEVKAAEEVKPNPVEEPALAPPVEKKAEDKVVVEEKPLAPAVAEEPKAAVAEKAPAPVDVPEEDELKGVKVGEAADSSRITVSLDSVEMADVIRLFTRLSGANIICNTTNLTGNVTANIENKDWKAALSLILQGQNLILTEDRNEDGIYIIEPKPPKEQEPWETETFKLSYLKSSEAATILKSFLGIKDDPSAKRASRRKSSKDGQGEEKITETAILENGRVVSYPAANIVVVSAPAYKLREIREVLRQVDVERPQVYIEAKIVEVSGDASSKIGIDWSSLLGGYELGVSKLGREYTKTRNRGTASSWANQGNNGRLTGTAEGGAAKPVFPAGGEDAPSPWGSTYYSSIDSVSSGRNGGWTLDSQGKANFSDKSVNDVYSAILSAADFSVVMSALKTSDDVAQISNPKLVVANEEQAVIDMSTKDPYVKVESTKDGTGTETTWTYSTEMETIPVGDDKSVPYIEGAFFSYGIQLKVTPRINNPSNITVSIEPTISYLNQSAPDTVMGYYYPVKASSSKDASTQTRYPVIESKRVQSTFALGNGQTAVIGGLTQSYDTEVVKKVPVLGDIPVLKYLFSHTEKVKKQKETVLFVTVGIVDSQKRESAMQLPEGARLVQKRIDKDGKIIDKEVEEAKAKAKADGVAVPEAVKAK